MGITYSRWRRRRRKEGEEAEIKKHLAATVIKIIKSGGRRERRGQINILLVLPALGEKCCWAAKFVRLYEFETAPLHWIPREPAPRGKKFNQCQITETDGGTLSLRFSLLWGR